MTDSGDAGVSSHYLDTASEPTHSAPAGALTPLVLLHGFPFSGAMWRPQLQPLSRSRRLIVPDGRGFGATPLLDQSGEMPEPSLEVLADDLATLLDHLELEQVVLGGSSMGGYVAMAFLRRHPKRVAGLLFCGTKARGDSEAERTNRLRMAETVERNGGVQSLFEGFVPQLCGSTSHARRPHIVAQVEAWARDADWAAVAWSQRAMASRVSAIDILSTIDVPTLVAVGDEDRLAPVTDSVAMVNAMPRAQLARISDAGHVSNVEDPTAFNAVVMEFLDQLA